MAEKLKKSALIFRPIQNSVEIYKVVDINFQSARFQCCNNSYFIVFLIPTIIDIFMSDEALHKNNGEHGGQITNK